MTKNASAARPSLIVIVVSYNTREMTLECLRSLYRETKDVDFEVVVIDNASHDGSAEAIRKEFGQARLFALDENIGFAAANNLAAERCDSEYILLLNPDTVVFDRALEKLLAFAKSRPQAGIWGGRTIFADGTLNPGSCWRRLTVWGLLCDALGFQSAFPKSGFFNPQGYGGWKRDTVREVDIVTGCLFLITREWWERLGGFDPRFFMYGEEADLCLRARGAGCRPVITPDSVIIHHGGASETIPEDKLVRLLRSQTLLIRRHWSPILAPVGVALLRLCALNRGLFGRLPRSITPQRLRDRSATWRSVWRRRNEWQAA